MEKRSKWKSAGRTDSSNSTFKHLIYLENGIILTGYSKSLLGRESADKIVMLEREIVRLVNNGYIFGLTKNYRHKTLKMEFYLSGNFKNAPDELLFTLYKDEYVFQSEDYLSDIRFSTFLHRLYTQAEKGELTMKSLIHKPVTMVENSQLSIAKKRFSTEKELYAHITDMMRHFPKGEVLDFYYKYRSKWLDIA